MRLLEPILMTFGALTIATVACTGGQTFEPVPTAPCDEELQPAILAQPAPGMEFAPSGPLAAAAGTRTAAISWHDGTEGTVDVELSDPTELQHLASTPRREGAVCVGRYSGQITVVVDADDGTLQGTFDAALTLQAPDRAEFWALIPATDLSWDDVAAAVGQGSGVGSVAIWGTVTSTSTIDGGFEWYGPAAGPLDEEADREVLATW